MIFKDVIDAIVAVIFCTSLFFGGKATYEFFRNETVKVLRRGQNNTLDFSRSLTGKRFDWEK